MTSRIVSQVDIGDQVLCDLCSAEHTAENSSTGGVLVLSYAYCPACAPAMLKRLEKDGELDYVKARCPPFLTFHAWVMLLRGGNNIITVTAIDP